MLYGPLADPSRRVRVTVAPHPNPRVLMRTAAAKSPLMHHRVRATQVVCADALMLRDHVCATHVARLSCILKIQTWNH
eukprot:1889018-Prymnesium_polylepis.1